MSRASSSKRNKFGPDLPRYYRHVLELLSEKEEEVSTIMPSGESSGRDSRGEIQGVLTRDNGKKCQRCQRCQRCRDSFPLFTQSVGSLSEYNKERLKFVLHVAATSLSEEADKIRDQISVLTSLASGSDEEIVVAEPRAKKRKAASFLGSNDSERDHGLPSADTFRQVRSDIQAVEGRGEIQQEAVEEDTARLSAQLVKMAKGIDELLNEVASKCRPMTKTEKCKLGERIRKLPEKAFNRVVEIVEMRSSSRQNYEKITFHLEQEDALTLWRLYYYVELVLKANKL